MYYLFSLASYLSLLWVFGLSDLTNHEQVLIPHDTFYPVSDYLNSTVFATFNSGINFGNNLLALMVLTPDAVVIGGLRFFFNNWTTQIIHIFLCLIVFHTTSFLCIKKIFGSSKLAYFLTLCYFRLLLVWAEWRAYKLTVVAGNNIGICKAFST